MISFRVGSGELNVKITFQEDDVTSREAAVEVLRRNTDKALGEVVIVEVCYDGSPKRPDAGAIFATMELVEESELDSSMVPITIKTMYDRQPKLKIYLDED